MMPITNALELLPCERDEFQETDYHVTGIAFQVQNELGTLLPEKIYQRMLAQRLQQEGYTIHTESPCELRCGSFIQEYFLDVVVNRRIIYELKTTRTIAPEHQSQLLNYLFINNSMQGKILNFRQKPLSCRYVNTSINPCDRMSCTLEDHGWSDPPDSPVSAALKGLLQEWGWGLEVNLYRDAIINLTSKVRTQPAEVPLRDASSDPGSMKFFLFKDGFLNVSALRKNKKAYEDSLMKTLFLTPFSKAYWINFDLGNVSLKTLSV